MYMCVGERGCFLFDARIRCAFYCDFIRFYAGDRGDFGG